LGNRPNDSQLKRLKEIQPFIRLSAQGIVRKDRAFLHCVRASLVKSFEFCLEAYKPRASHSAFFSVPSLRSICEDLIVLSYMTKMSNADRNQLILLLLQQELEARIGEQSRFFELARPDQPVIQPGMIDKTKTEDAIREIWKRNGWAGLTSGWKPTTRQIAEKNHVDILTTLYDYLYRLTSGAVHFNPQVLLRSGWGKPIVRFSPKKFDSYYVAYARIYGLFLFCCYFELFGRFLRPNKKIASLVTELRWNLVSEPRWPEMVTHEEMEFRLPKRDNTPRLAYRYVDAHRRKRKLLNAPPDRESTLRHVNRVLAGLRRMGKGGRSSDPRTLVGGRRAKARMADRK
jgi:Family of unknown function (DUF5677)